jgi:protein-disulfide isomerase
VANQQNTSAIIGAVIIGVALIVTGFIVKAAVDNATAQLSGIKLALADTQEALEQVAKAQPAAAPAPARRGPDPNRRYEVKTDGSPVKGPQTAKVSIVEFSDFQ